MLKSYCTGCGLCKSVFNKSLSLDSKGFLVISDYSKKDEELLKEVCPCFGKSMSEYDGNNIWGRNKGVFLGSSADKDIQYKSSSGGVLTALSIYLLENKIVDGVIQTTYSKDDPTKTITVCSYNKKEVISCCGSRYGMSSPLENIELFLSSDKTFAFIGKPCDIVALKNYGKLDARVHERIKVFLSFFCAGTPSVYAQKKLLHRMNCNNCKSLTYRGNGWPGLTIAIDENGTKHELDYVSSWGDILGRDLRLMCKCCIDSIGESADISCGDAWYIKDGKPSFDENVGRNVVFARTELGLELLKNAENGGYIELSNYDNFENELKITQQSQFLRRACMNSMLLSFKLFGKKVPLYQKKILKKYSRNVNLKIKIKRFLGTAKRIINKKI